MNLGVVVFEGQNRGIFGVILDLWVIEGGSKSRKGDKGAEKGSVDPDRWTGQAVMS